jgi:hypothetical protein
MKTFLKSIFKFIQSIFLQFILSLVAIISWVNCQELGNNSEVGTYEKELGNTLEFETVGTSVGTGFNGGAISMGIICSVCIVMIVWLEINKKSNL